MELSYKLEAFEGPLDLLLHLIEKNKVNIYDIPIVEITEQYLDYIRNMDRDLDVMSEFLVMAATLIDIKSRWLLPKEESDDGEEEGDPREELVERLLQYKMYKYMSLELKDRQIDAGRHLYKIPTIPKEVLQYEEPYDLDELTKGFDLNKLNDIFNSVIKKQNDKLDPIRSKFGKIEKEEVSLEDKMASIREYINNNETFLFTELLSRQSSKTEMVVTFFAILEFMKTGLICVDQEELFGDIRIRRNI